MKILLYGAGVIGTTYAWQLSQAEQDITLLVRGDKKSRIEQEGIRIRCNDLRKKPGRQVDAIYHPLVVEELLPEADYDLVIVSTCKAAPCPLESTSVCLAAAANHVGRQA